MRKVISKLFMPVLALSLVTNIAMPTASQAGEGLEYALIGGLIVAATIAGISASAGPSNGPLFGSNVNPLKAVKETEPYRRVALILGSEKSADNLYRRVHEQWSQERIETEFGKDPEQKAKLHATFEEAKAAAAERQGQVSQQAKPADKKDSGEDNTSATPPSELKARRI